MISTMKKTLKAFKKKTVKSIYSYKDLIDEYKNDELDYFKLLISSQRDELFYSSLKDLNEFKTLLKKISNLDNLNLSNESQLLLTYLEENILTEKDYKKIQEIYFVKFDHMTSTLINLGDKDENFYKISHFFIRKDIFHKMKSTE